MTKFSELVLRHPTLIAGLVLLLGIGGGLAANYLFKNNLFERFGSFTVALGVFSFGSVSSELLNRSQDGRWAREDDFSGGIYSRKNIRNTMFWQTAIVSIGTIQWGFGGLVWESINANP